MDIAPKELELAMKFISIGSELETEIWKHIKNTQKKCDIITLIL